MADKISEVVVFSDLGSVYWLVWLIMVVSIVYLA